MSELHGMSNSHDTSQRLHGDDATFDAPWVQGKDEISLVTWIKDWEVEPPYDLWNTHDERSTFWNGEPNDAETRFKYDKVRYFVEGNKFQEGQIHRAEAESQWRYHFWHAKGEVQGADDDPANEPLLADEAAATDGDPPPRRSGATRSCGSSTPPGRKSGTTRLSATSAATASRWNGWPRTAGVGPVRTPLDRRHRLRPRHPPAPRRGTPSRPTRTVNTSTSRSCSPVR